METKDLNFNGRELPSYLGYGILDEKTVRFENDVIRADYVLECDGSVVHRITWDKSHCELETLLHGSFAGFSSYTDLDKALSYDFMSRNLAEDNVFNFLSETTIGMGNIYIQQPDSKEKGKPKVVYFPAGLLMCFRLPVIDNGWDYQAFLLTINESGFAKLRLERNSCLLLADPSLKVTIRPLVVAEFIVPLAYMTGAARIFAESGIIESGKPFRLMIAESYQVANAYMQTFPGTEDNPYFGYCFQNIPKEKHSILADFFTVAIRNLFQTTEQPDNW